MNFGHYTNEAAEMASDLVNTVGSDSGDEYLPDPAALHDFMETHFLAPPDEITIRDVEEVRELRARLHEVFHVADAEAKVDLLNRLLEESGTSPRITGHDEHPWHFHYVPNDASVARRMMAVGAMGLAAVICEYGVDRLGSCASDRCDDAFVDVSKNLSKRYCSNSCASRANVAAYRARQKSTQAN